jgi:methyl-accepting chemotaxis protein
MTTALTSPPENTAAYRRSVRNYLLDSRFQLKYSAVLVIVAIANSGVMGAALYTTTRAVFDESSAAVEESRKVSEVSRMNVREFAPDSPELMAEFNKEVLAHDAAFADTQELLRNRQRTMIKVLVGGLALMVVAIGLLGIYFTHKVAGPVFKMKKLLKRVGEGHLQFDGRLRKGDELVDFFDSFTQMVSGLREMEANQLAEVESAIQALDRGGAQEAASALGRLRDSMKGALAK